MNKIERYNDKKFEAIKKLMPFHFEADYDDEVKWWNTQSDLSDVEWSSRQISDHKHIIQMIYHLGAL